MNLIVEVDFENRIEKIKLDCTSFIQEYENQISGLTTDLDNFDKRLSELDKIANAKKNELMVVSVRILSSSFESEGDLYKPKQRITYEAYRMQRHKAISGVGGMTLDYTQEDDLESKRATLVGSSIILEYDNKRKH